MAFEGLSAFPLTPLVDGEVDVPAFTRIMRMVRVSGATSIGALGSAGAGVYLSEKTREQAAEIALEIGQGKSVILGVSALATEDVLRNVKMAERLGANGLLLAPMSYLPLKDAEVFELYRRVTEATSIPIVVYDNPATTNYNFSTEMYARIASLPGIASIKIPGKAMNDTDMRKRVEEIRSVIPAEVTLGISGDAFAAQGIAAGCKTWYSVLAGTLPKVAEEISKLAFTGKHSQAAEASNQLQALWDLYFEMGGSIRVMAAIAEELEMVVSPCLPEPLLPLEESEKARVREVLTTSSALQP